MGQYRGDLVGSEDAIANFNNKLLSRTLKVTVPVRWYHQINPSSQRGPRGLPFCDGNFVFHFLGANIELQY
jgi:hypothetical protein